MITSETVQALVAPGQVQGAVEKNVSRLLVELFERVEALEGHTLINYRQDDD